MDPADDGIGTTADGRSRSTHFVFEHKVFHILGAFFSVTPGSREPVYNVPMGETRAAIPFPALRTTFDIDERGPDGRMLKVVEDGLAFVRVIRPGEHIPRELLDGSASWSVEDHHRGIARGRLVAAVLAWNGDTVAVPADRKDRAQANPFEHLLDGAEMVARYSSAINHLTTEAGLSIDERQEVVDRLEAFGHELAYIEALRERAGAVRRIGENVQKARKLYPVEKQFLNDMTKIVGMLRQPAQEFDQLFKPVDKALTEVVALVRRFRQAIDAVRGTRDRLHVKLMEWDEILRPWDTVDIVRSPDLEQAIRRTHRFLAQRYLTAQVWARSG